MHKSLFLVQYSFSTYFRSPFWYWIVQDVSFSRFKSISLTHHLNDQNFRKGGRLCADMRSIPGVGVTSAKYWHSSWQANFVAKDKSSFH
jgi:hypothetical protein